MRAFGRSRDEGDSGLIWGGLLLAFTAMFAWLFLDDLGDALSDEAVLLSPASLATLELDPNREQLVDVEGFTIDCENATFEGERLLAPGLAPTSSALILVEFEHGSDCREFVAEQRGPFRAKATSTSPELRKRLGLEALARRQLAIVEPHEVPYWLLLLMAGFGGLGVYGVYSAFAERKQRLAKLQGTPTAADDPSESDDRMPGDPYRPGEPGRLITEAIAPAPKFLAKLRLARRLQLGLGGLALAGALTWASLSGVAIYEREQIWSTGIVAKDAVATGETRRSALIAVSTKLDVTFIDGAGRLHREEASAFSLIVGVDDAVAPTVRYLPDEPERFAVSWIHEQLWGSIAMLVLGVGGLLALGIALVVSARRDRRPEQAAAVFEDPREALLELIAVERQVVNGNETGAFTQHFRVRDSERELAYFVAIKQPAPLLLDDAHRVGIALYNPRDPEYLMVLTEGLAEIANPPFTAAQLRGRYQAGVNAEGVNAEG